MLQNSVNDDYINFIIEIENGTVENEEYSDEYKENFEHDSSRYI